MIRPALKELESREFDLLVAGGGINGAGVAREAALRGLSVCLVEKNDWAFGTSSRSTKLVHGGLRYLETYQFGLVLESSRERRLLHDRLAPHLVRPLPFLIPFYRTDRHSPLMLKAGLWLYDLLALFRNVHNHQVLSRTAALARMPGLSAEGLLGAALIWDCSMNDARMVLENVQDAARLGAVCRSYTRLAGVDSLKSGAVQARLEDADSGAGARVRAKFFINAGGPWVDAICQAATGLPSQKIMPSKGVHLITRPLSQDALLATIPSDGRIFFIIPRTFEGRSASLIGTTDSPFEGDLDRVAAQEGEVAYLIEQTNRVLSGARLSRKDIWSTYAGVRPMARPQGEKSLQAVPREAVLHLEQGMLSITGGKFTTYRSLAEQVVTQAAHAAMLPAKPSRSQKEPLPGAPPVGTKWEAYKARQSAILVDAYDLTPAQADWLLSTYGSRVGMVLSLLQSQPELKQPLAPDLPVLGVEAAWAAQEEDALHLADFYLRRSFLGLLPTSTQAMQNAAQIMGRTLSWSQARQIQEVEDLKTILKSEYTHLES